MAKSNKKGSGCAIAGAGCGTVLVLALAVLAVGGYFAFKLIKGSYSGLKELTEIALIENEVVNQTQYVPPTDGMMSLEQVQSLVYVQTQIKEAMGPEFASLSAEHKDLITELEQMSDFGKVRKLLSISRRLVKPLSDAKRVQIDAINREGISMSEYKWMRNQAMTALGLPQRKFDIRRVLDSVSGERSEEADEQQAEIETVANPQNRRLLEPHTVVLTETLMLSAIGL